MKGKAIDRLPDLLRLPQLGPSPTLSYGGDRRPRNIRKGRWRNRLSAVSS